MSYNKAKFCHSVLILGLLFISYFSLNMYACGLCGYYKEGIRGLPIEATLMIRASFGLTIDKVNTGLSSTTEEEEKKLAPVRYLNEIPEF